MLLAIHLRDVLEFPTSLKSFLMGVLDGSLFFLVAS
jgi:hypothetical protein